MSKRDDLRKAFHTRVKPRLLELGFESTRTKAGRLKWPGLQEYSYARRRGVDLDQLLVQWDRYGAPSVTIFFSTYIEAEFGTWQGDTPSYRSGSIDFGVNRLQEAIWRLGLPFHRIDIDEIVTNGLRDLDALDGFLRTGEAHPGISWWDFERNRHGAVAEPPRGLGYGLAAAAWMFVASVGLFAFLLNPKPRD